MSAISTRSLGAAFTAITGEGSVLSDPPFLIDGVRPRWRVAVNTASQVAGVLALAADADLTVCPVGSGSSLELGGVVEHVDVALSLHRLDTVLEDHPEDLTISVEVGVTLDMLRSRLAARRQLLPIDPPGGGARTLGGIAATNAYGPLRLRYRTVRDLLLGVRFVQADGVSTWGGARVVKSVTGYDVPKLMVGSLGTLGVLTELTLRLQPMPDVTRTWLATAPSLERTAEIAGRLMDSAVQPSRVEWLNAESLRAAGLDPAPGALAVSIGSVEEAVEAQAAVLGRFARLSGGRAVAVPERFWDAYEHAVAPEPGWTWLRIATLPARLADVARALESAVPGARVAGSAALGLLRVGFVDHDPETAADTVEGLRRLVAGERGSVVIEAGPRALRSLVDPWGPVEPGALDLMRGLKTRFDPRGVLNPGRFVGGL